MSGCRWCAQSVSAPDFPAGPCHCLAGTTEEGKMAAYSEMGKSGAKKGGYSTGYAHDPEEQAKYTDRTGNETPMDE